jgi:hypothetical protein
VLTEAHYEAIGRVAVAAAQLEARVCMLLVLVRGNEGDAHEMATKNNSQWRDELRKRANGLDSPAGTAICDWLDGLESTLKERHRLMHSEWMRDGTSQVRSPIGLHPRRDQASRRIVLDLIPASETTWRGLADRLNDLHHRSEPLVRTAAVACGLVD